MSKLIYNFNTMEQPKLAEVGGKAKSLIETTKAGFPVPEGFVLTVEFFYPWLEKLKSEAEWNTFLEDVTRQKCDNLKNKLFEYEMTEVQKSSLEIEIKKLEEYSVFAVRSSSPEEDLEGTSFAGMYETYLGITKDYLISAIKKTFASMIDFRVLEYKSLNDIDISGTKISIIIQRMIPSDVSGIGFSLNPQNNCYDEAVINSSFGLGEMIVGGQITPDSFVVDKVKNKIIDKVINEKSIALWLKKDGDTEAKENENPEHPSLNDVQVLEVTKLISKCEDHYDLPIDTEWAYYNNQLYLLQARPITTYIPLYPEMITKPGEEKVFYVDLIGCAQGFSTPLSVLGLDIWRRVSDTIGGQGTMPAGKGGLITNLHGKQYFNASNMFKTFPASMCFSILGNMDYAISERKEELLSLYKATKTTKQIKSAKIAIFKLAFSFIPMMIKMSINPDKVKNKYLKVIDETIIKLKSITNNTDFENVAANGFDILNTIGIYTVAQQPGEAALRKIKKIFKDFDLHDRISEIGMDLMSNSTARMGKKLYELACEDELLKISSKEEFIKKIEDRSFSVKFMDKYESYIYLYGDRGFMEIDVATPRIKDNPSLLYQQLSNINIANNQMIKSAERKMEAYRILRKKASELKRLKAFEKNARIYEQIFGFRETPKYLAALLIGNLNGLAKEIGTEFVEKGRLERREQIFDLTAAQIARAQQNSKYKLLPVIAENLKPYKSMENIKQWPTNIDSRGKIYNPLPKGKDGDMVGEAIANGVIKGYAKVLATPYEKPVHPGEILVTHATEPSWTPIFINASGVVLEVGGSLQHGAIIAREYGIPCVSGIRDATVTIKDGDYLEVDGTSGIVRILNDKTT